MRVVSNKKRTNSNSRSSQPKSHSTTEPINGEQQQQKVDAILDKIGKSGYDSLTEAEKEFLFKASGKR